MKLRYYFCDKCGHEILGYLLTFEVPGRGKVNLCEQCEPQFAAWLTAKANSKWKTQKIAKELSVVLLILWPILEAALGI